MSTSQSVTLWLQGAAVTIILLLALGTALFILRDMWTGKISLARLLSEANGDASMSRLQLLIFTFVIALSFLYLTLNNPAGGFPVVPAQVLTLLGISGSTYLVSKGIQSANPNANGQPGLVVSPNGAKASPGTPLNFSVATSNGATVAAADVIWSLDAPATGSIVPTASGVIYTPVANVPANTQVTLRAQMAGFIDGLAKITYSDQVPNGDAGGG